MFPQDYKEKDISGEGVASKGLQEAGLHLGTLLWRLAHAWDSILSRLTRPWARSQRLSKQKAQAEVQLESPQRFPPSPSHFMHEGRILQVGQGCQLFGGPFPMSVPLCLLQGSQHSHGVQTEIPCRVT